MRLEIEEPMRLELEEPDDQTAWRLRTLASNSSRLILQNALLGIGHAEQPTNKTSTEEQALQTSTWSVIILIGVLCICTLVYVLWKAWATGSSTTDGHVSPADVSARFRMLLTVRVITAGTSIGEGYALGCVSSAIVLISDDLKLDSLQSAWFLGAAHAAMAFGAPVGGWGADQIGRKPILAASYVLIAAGALAMAFAPSFGWLISGRLIESIGVGIGISTVTTYLAEVAPSRHRGSFASLEHPFVLFGRAAGSIISRMLLHVPNGWHWILGIAAVLPIVMIPCLRILPESPRFLALQDRRDEAARVLRQFVDEAEADEFLCSCRDTGAEGVQARLSEIFCPQGETRQRAVFASLGIVLFAQLTGISIIANLLPTMLTKVMTYEGAFNAIIGLHIAGVGFSFLSSNIVDMVGRRPLLLISSFGLTSALMFLGLAWRLEWGVSWRLVFLLCYLAAFDLGMGPVTYVYMSEVLETRLRSKGVAVAFCSSRMLAFCMMLIYPIARDYFGNDGIIFLWLAGFNVCGFCFVCLFVPETMGTSLEAMYKHVFVSRLVNRRQTTTSVPEMHAQQGPSISRIHTEPVSPSSHVDDGADKNASNCSNRFADTRLPSRSEIKSP